MTDDPRREIRVLLHRSGSEAALEHRLTLRSDAALSDLLDALRDEAPAFYEAACARIVRSAAHVLAFGAPDGLLTRMQTQLTNGGPVIVTAVDDRAAALSVG